MGHHRRHAQTRDEALANESQSPRPLLEASDLALLALFLPLLSEKGKQIISSFTNLGNQAISPSSLDIPGLLSHISTKMENSPLKEILPSLLTLATNQENKTALNPNLIAPLLALLSNKKED